MKNKKELHLLLDKNLYQKIKESADNNNISVNKTIELLIDKGLSKNRNDYNELINFLSKNIVTKINKEFTDYRYFLRKFLLNSSVNSVNVSAPAPKFDGKKDDDKPEKKENFFDKLK